MKPTKSLIKNFLNAHWLRFENLPWDIQVAMFFQKYKPKKIKRSLEVGVGNGINTLLNLGGSLKKNEDHFSNLSLLSTSNKDYWNTFKRKRNPIYKSANGRFDIALDHKKNLLKNAENLGISKKYILYDCNKSFDKFGKFDFIYSNIIYWLKNPIKSIKNFEEVLYINGHIMLTIPNQNFFKYSETFKSNNKFLNFINFGRRKHYKFFNNNGSFDRILKKNKNLKVIKKKSILSKNSLKFWDIGNRILFPVYSNHSNYEISKKKRLNLKNATIRRLMPYVTKLVSQEMVDIYIKNLPGAYDLYLIKKIK